MNPKVEVLDMELAGKCQYRCTMCPQSQPGGREKEFLQQLPFDVFCKVVDDALQYGLHTVTLHGSGEPLLNKAMPKYVEYVKKRGLRCISFTNGELLTSTKARQLINAGIDLLRISAIGYDRATYHHWMSRDVFYKVRDNAREFVAINAAQRGMSALHLHHLVIDASNIEREIEQYRRNWGEYVDCPSEIWLMHNWSGSDVELGYQRVNLKRDERSCGRPAAPLLQVRAGGLDGHNAAVVACCMVLGKDSQAVLGHLDDQTIEQVVNGEKYVALRQAHAEERWNEIPYCQGCDQLYDVPEALVWSNIPGREYGTSKSSDNLDFRKYAGIQLEFNEPGSKT